MWRRKSDSGSIGFSSWLLNRHCRKLLFEGCCFSAARNAAESGPGFLVFDSTCSQLDFRLNFMSGQIMWADELGKSRCEIPDATLPMVKLMSWVGMGFGLFITGIPFLFAGLSWLMSPESLDPVMLLVPIGFFGMVTFPIAAFILYKTLLLLFGRK